MRVLLQVFAESRRSSDREPNFFEKKKQGKKTDVDMRLAPGSCRPDCVVLRWFRFQRATVDVQNVNDGWQVIPISGRYISIRFPRVIALFQCVQN
jgi:hypothetical protein